MPDIYGTPCEACPYRAGNRHYQRPGAPLSMERNDGATLLIFQAPGIQEWEQRQPLISDSPRSAAARVRNSLTRVGRERADFSITNTVQCYPGASARTGRDQRPRKAAHECCSAWLLQDIEQHNWEKIVVFGAVAKAAVRSLFGDDGCPGNVVFVKHPSGGLTNEDLDDALKEDVDDAH